ncbi:MULTISPECIES: PD-(D/E)XK nuclease family protein [Psychrobacter]|uniref:PDDEXK-like family protein n=3 Tax=Gammaproteobacteria TaxID=1236 RepID=UPI000412B665|nr:MULTISPECIES: PD-(D/E)XK nuclease family protein [Psychrobacter]
MLGENFKQSIARLQEKEQASQKQHDDAKLDFNVFTILRKTGEEVGLHSRFLAEILNPKASHKIAGFQQLFIETIINNAIATQEWKRDELDSNITYSCEIEYSFRNSAHGRADIILRNTKNVIVIENKIYAFDQKGQLAKYYKACQELGYDDKNIYILYLNRFGDDVSHYGKGDLNNKDYGVISYKKDIFNFLSLCKEEVVDYPHIEQTIEQYISTVARITGQTRNSKMRQEYVDFLADDNNFKTVYELSQNFEAFQQHIQNKTWNDLLNYLGKKNLEFTFCDKNLLPCSQEKSVKNYFKRSKNTYGLCYKITEKEDVGIYCYIELNHHLYYSITLANKDGLRLPECPLDMVGFEEKVGELCKNWKYQDKKKNLGGQIYPQRPVNFKNPNDNFFDIVYEQKLQQWIAETADDIIQLINDVKNINVQQA